MTNKERIEAAIRHIQTAVDIDPWAQELAIEALKAQSQTDGDCISRQAAQTELMMKCKRYTLASEQHGMGLVEWSGELIGLSDAMDALRDLPSAQPDRDIPKKPNETTDKAWGIPHRQAVCPNCDCYLGTVHFLCEGDKRKVTYCESCGQAIDWEGWKNDEGD